MCECWGRLTEVGTKTRVFWQMKGDLNRHGRSFHLPVSLRTSAQLRNHAETRRSPDPSKHTNYAAWPIQRLLSHTAG